MPRVFPFLCILAFAQAAAGDVEQAMCKVDQITLPAQLAAAADERRIRLQADEIETDGERRIMLQGEAEVVRGGRGLYAERIVYDRATGTASAAGEVAYYTAYGDEIRAEKLDLQLDSRRGRGEGVELRLAERGLRGASLYQGGERTPSVGVGNPPTPFIKGGLKAPFVKRGVKARANAARVDFIGDDLQVLSDVTMSTCAAGNDDVLLGAKRIELNHETAVGSARSMTLRFKGVPIFYLPFATFPLTDARKSGFLFPSAGYDETSGTILEVPYYFNLAPNYDASLVARGLQRRGLQWGGEFRHLTETGRARLRGEYLATDKQYESRPRYALRYDDSRRFGENWRAAVDWRTLSDADYLRDFDADADSIAASYVGRRAEVNYAGRAVRLHMRGEGYQPTDNAIERAMRPWQTLPQVRFSLRPLRFGYAEVGLDSEYAEFRHRERPDGARLLLKPYFALPLRRPGYYLRPQIALHSARYELKGAAEDSLRAQVPIYRLDGGLVFEREAGGGRSLRQTLEPRFSYLKIPLKRVQDDFPNFDAGMGSRDNLAYFFRDNRFVGGDRVGDTRQVAAAVESRLFAADGRQLLQLGAGQVFYLRDRELGLTADAAAQTVNRSGWFGEVEITPDDKWAVRGFVHDSVVDADDRVRFSLEHNQQRRRASLTYVYRRDAREQLNLAWRSALGLRWRAEGDAGYSLHADELRAAKLGVAFDGCCWTMRLLARRYIGGDGELKSRFEFGFALEDLGRVGSRASGI